MPRDRFPARTVRDLIDLVRSLYFVWREAGVPAARLEELLRFGRELRGALELALRSKPDSLEHRAARVKAERATAALCILIDAKQRAPIGLAGSAGRRSSAMLSASAFEPASSKRARAR